LLNEIGSLFGVLKYVCDIVVKKFTFAISSPDEFLSVLTSAIISGTIEARVVKFCTQIEYIKR